MTDHYEILGVSRTAPDEVIRAAYKARIRQTHPDAGGSAADAQAVNEAHEVLSVPHRRAAYDRELADSAPPARPAASDRQTVAPPPTSHATATSRSQPEPIAAPPIARWYRARSFLALGAVWLVAAIAQAVVAGVIESAWLIGAGGVIAAGVLTAAVARRSLPGMLVVTILWGSLVGLAGASTVGGACLWALSIALGAAARYAIRREDDELALAWVGRFWETVVSNPNADAWFVENSAPDRSQTHTLLQHTQTDQRATRTLWGHVEAGSLVLLTNGHDEPLMTVPSMIVERSVVARKRFARR